MQWESVISQHQFYNTRLIQSMAKLQWGHTEGPKGPDSDPLTSETTYRTITELCSQLHLSDHEFFFSASFARLQINFCCKGKWKVLRPISSFEAKWIISEYLHFVYYPQQIHCVAAHRKRGRRRKSERDREGGREGECESERFHFNLALESTFHHQGSSVADNLHQLNFVPIKSGPI